METPETNAETSAQHTRRDMIRVLSGVLAYTFGTVQPARGAQGDGILLILDGKATAATIQYNGQRVVITPQMIIDAWK